MRSLTLDGWEPEIVKVMMELGNDVINNIYEANYVDDTIEAESQVAQIKRATSECDTNVREMWIKAKYIQKAFVWPIDQLTSTESERAQSTIINSNVLKDIVFNESGWFVRHIRKKRITLRAEISDKGPKVDDSASSSELSIDSNQPNDELSLSDSTDDDEDAEYGTEEALENFSSNMLLYKATNVHNLPIMCYALAAGASKDWSNVKDVHRSAIHRAVLSVS